MRRVEQLAACVLGELPEHDSAESALACIRGLELDGPGVVVADETARRCIPQPGRLRCLVPVTLESAAVHVAGNELRIRVISAVSLVGLIASKFVGVHTLEPPAIERNAEHELAGGNTGGEMLLHRRVRP